MIFKFTDIESPLKSQDPTLLIRDLTLEKQTCWSWEFNHLWSSYILLVNILSWFSPFSASRISQVSLHMLSVMPLSFISYLKVMITLKLYVFSNVLMVPGKKKPSDFILLTTVSPKLFKYLKHWTDPCISFYQYQSESTLYKFQQPLSYCFPRLSIRPCLTLLRLP